MKLGIGVFFASMISAVPGSYPGYNEVFFPDTHSIPVSMPVNRAYEDSSEYVELLDAPELPDVPTVTRSQSEEGGELAACPPLCGSISKEMHVFEQIPAQPEALISAIA